jgi:hypothetical protein
MGQASGEVPTDQRLLHVHPAPEWCHLIARGAAADIAPAVAAARTLRLDSIAFAPVETVTPLLRTQVALDRRMSAARRRHSVALAHLSLGWELIQLIDFGYIFAPDLSRWGRSSWRRVCCGCRMRPGGRSARTCRVAGRASRGSTTARSSRASCMS